MNELQDKLLAYTNAWWNNKEIAIVTGLSPAETSKVKQKIVKAGGGVIGHGQKVYRDKACQILGIDVKQEIELIKMVLEPKRKVSKNATT